jgi:pilus assembly protein CpaB
MQQACLNSRDLNNVNQAREQGRAVASRRSYTSWIFLGAALVAGGLAFWLSQLYLARQEEIIRHDVAGSQRNLVEIVVASKALSAGEVVGNGTMALGRLPAAYVSARFVTPSRFDAVKGKVLLRDKAAGEPLMVDDVAGVAVERFSDLLKPGERAVTLEASELKSNSGLLLPGDYIDLFVLPQFHDSSGDHDQSLVPVLQHVRVLAAGAQALRAKDQEYQTLDQRDTRYSTITVAVDVLDAEKLILARKGGDIAYLLRNSSDDAADPATVLSLSAVMGRPERSTQDAGAYQYFSAQFPAGVVRHLTSESAAADAAPGIDSGGGGDSAGLAPAGREAMPVNAQ